MDLLTFLNSLAGDYTLRIVALGSAVIGLAAGALGSFALLRRQSLLGDAISHAALPGIVLAYLITGSKAPLALAAGALIAGILATLLMSLILRLSRIKQDSALALILSVFFGLGLMLLTFIQRRPDASQAGLDRFLFGQAATLLAEEVRVMAALGGTALLLMVIFWKELKLLAFDAEYAASLGLPVRLLDGLLTTLLAAAIVTGLQAVGVVLMSAMIVAPAAAARQWTDRLSWMVLLAGGFGALAGVTGTLISATGRGLSTGPSIVLVISIVVALSLLLAPNRGLAWRWLQRRRSRRHLAAELVLSDLYALARHHADPAHPHSLAALQAVNPGRGGLDRALARLAQRGWARSAGPDGWSLTPAGIAEAERLSRLDSTREATT